MTAEIETQAPASDRLTSWLVDRIAEMAGVAREDIDVRTALVQYGVGSVQALALTAGLGRLVGRKLPATLLWDQPTIEALVAHLAGVGADPSPHAADVRAPAPDRSVEPIAIVGLAARMPGGPDPAGFWRLLRDGIDATGEVPADRWDRDAYYDADPSAPGKAVSRRGAFLDQVDRFDPLFFGISPREAAELDPNQRLALELAWEALEDAGMPPPGLVGSRTGVYLGSMWHDWADLTLADVDGMNAHRATGQAVNMIANRVSYVLGLRGPSLMIDTACSSALVAIHLACQALRDGDATLALAGAVNHLLAPESMVFVSKFGGLARDGRCKTFDARADGFGRGEGGGIVVLKPLSRAIRDGDAIHALVRGSAINNDGASQGLTAPSPVAQAEVLEEAYRRAGIDRRAVHYVEAHGTGTGLGDPIEAGVIGRLLGAGRPPDRPLLVGSVKTNVAHLEGAAGIAGVLKVVLAMRHRQVPPNLHLETPNPHIALGDLNLQVPRALEPWPAGDSEPALAGVSAFGWGGTNAHVVLEGPPAAPVWIALAATGADELRARVEALRIEAGQRSLDAIARDSDRAEGGDHRLSIAVSGAAELAAACADVLAGRPSERVVAGVRPGRAPSVVFVCSPLGSQWVGMGRALARSEPVFRAAIERCDAAFRPLTGASVADQLFSEAPADRFDDVVLVQPLLFSLQVALAAQWGAWGLTPDVVIGHSAGEPAAACIAGILDLDDAARVVHHYSRVQAPTANRGAMALVEAPAEELAAALEAHAGRVVVAAHNSARSTVLSGERAAVNAVVAVLAGQGISATLIKSNVAGHSPLMDAGLGELEASLAGIRPRPARVPMISTVTTDALGGPAAGAAYWPRNLREPVRLVDVVRRLRRDGHEVFLELGPHPVLAGALRQIFDEGGEERGGAIALPSLRRSADERLTMLASRGQLFALGRIDAGRAAASALIAVSGKTAEAAREAARAAARALAGGDAELGDVAYTSSVRRAHHEHRLAVVAATTAEAAARLEAAASGEVAAGCEEGSADRAPRVVFVFPGQGSQWAGMGRRLLDGEPVFRAAIEACEEALAPHVTWSLVAELRAEAERSRLGEVDVVQPVLWAVEVALAALWRSWGIEPAALVGHSMGEVAAACVAGALSLADGARVIALRSRIAREHASGRGAMAVVELSGDDAAAAIAGREERLAVGVCNGPRSSVLSGDPAALDEVLAELEARGVFVRRVQVDYASHGPQMEPLRPLLLDALAPVQPRPAQLRFFSTVTAGWLGGDELDAGYWAANLREPVRFAQAVQALATSGHELFLEMSPHPILVGAIEDGLRHAGSGGRAVGSLHRQRDERAALLEAVAALHVRGAPVDLRALHPRGGRLVDWPTYPWQRARFWIERRAARPARAVRPVGAGEHPFLGDPIVTPAQPDLRIWQWQLAPASAPWLGDHRVGEAIVWPAAATIDLALAAARRGFAREATLRQLVLDEALVLADDEPRELQLVLVRAGASADAEIRFQLFSADGSAANSPDAWRLHATGALVAASAREAGGDRPAGIAARLASRRSGAEFYGALSRRGLCYGPRFRGLIEIAWSETEALGRVELDETGEGFAVHPALLDAAMQAVLAPLGDGSTTWLPVGAESVLAPEALGATCFTHARLRAGTADARAPGLGSGEPGEVVADVRLLDEGGRVLAAVLGLRLRALRGSLGQPRQRDGELLAVDWPVEPPAAPGRADGRWIVVADRGGLADAVAAELRGRGGRVDLVSSPVAVGAALGDGARAVLYLAGLDLPGVFDGPGTSAALNAVLDRGALGAIELVRAIAESPGRDRARLVLVTRGAQAAGGERALAPLQATLWGLGQTLVYEHPELACTRIDLGDRSAADEAAALVDAVLTGDGEDQIALRAEGRRVARLVRRRPERAAAPAISAERTYLITGGLGGLGLSLARWLVDRGARHLVLCGRRGATTEVQAAAIAALEADGADVLAAAVDVADERALAGLLATAEQRMPPVAGVVHAAGVLDDRTALHIDRAGLAAVMAPKLLGAWNLHWLTRERALDFFVLYSSAASLLGSPGQGNYAAANAFLDGLAAWRRAQGLPALSVSWGPVAEVGLAAADAGRGARLAALGMGWLTVDRVHAELERLMAADGAAAGVVPLDVRQWVESHPSLAGWPFLSRLATERAAPAAGATGDLRRRITAARPDERGRLMARVLQDEVVRLLRVEPARVRPDSNLTQLGLDSLVGLELRNRLEKGLAVRLPSTLAWSYPRIDALAAHLLSLLELPDEREAPPAPLPSDDDRAIQAGLSELSDQALMDFLAGELAAAGDDRRGA